MKLCVFTRQNHNITHKKQTKKGAKAPFIYYKHVCGV